MKLTGPFTVKIRRGRPELLDGAGRHIARLQWSSGYKEDDQDTMERIADALNRDEARKPTSRWSAEEYAGAFVRLKFDGKEVNSYHVVAALLNKLGATLPKHKPEREGALR